LIYHNLAKNITASCVYGDGLPIFFIYIHMDKMASGRCYNLIWAFIPFFKQGSMIAHRAIAKMGNANPNDKLDLDRPAQQNRYSLFRSPNKHAHYSENPALLFCTKKAVHGCIK
jgi:hypothetical protein